jgi:cell division protein FtsB
MKFVNFTLLILLVLLQIRLWHGNGSVPDVWSLEEIKAAQIAENEKLTERNLSLEAEVMDLKQGMEAIEERARSEMGMVGSGETFYIIVDKPESITSTPRE